MVYLLLVSALAIGVFSCAAYLFVSARLRRFARWSGYECHFSALRYALEVGTITSDLSADERWLVTQISENARRYGSPVGLKSTIATLERLRSDKSRGRELFVRRIVRTANETHHEWLRRS